MEVVKLVTKLVPFNSCLYMFCARNKDVEVLNIGNTSWHVFSLWNSRLVLKYAKGLA